MSQESLRRLFGWLDEGTDSGGNSYLEIRRRLVLYFDRKNCLSPDELADETLNRVARRLEEEGSIESDSPAHYCYIVARFVFLEYTRKPDTETLNEDSTPRSGTVSLIAPAVSTEDQMERERRNECLSRCLE
ncbi:MAG TPA: hypothetical protein VEZ90_10575, partial [Blastocatellia bacterium]|nr:hypothetical protein [Blastocatellia bacterium]